MAQINNHYLNLHRMNHEELVQARFYAEERIRLALVDIEKLNGELACRETVEIDLDIRY